MLLQLGLRQAESVSGLGYFMNYFLIIAAFVALAVLFINKLEKFKALPYIVFVLMLAVIIIMTDVFLLFTDNYGFIANLTRNLRNINDNGRIGLSIFAGIPILTLLVTTLIKKFKK